MTHTFADKALSAEQNGQKLYVPVENPSLAAHVLPRQTKASEGLKSTPAIDDDAMRLDDTKHKVYIYNIDDELSESEDEGKLILLPDIEKHLLNNRIPASVLANSQGELAGQNQLVLYSVPSSLSVPEEKDSVRKAIIEARARARGNHDTASSSVPTVAAAEERPEMDAGAGMNVMADGLSGAQTPWPAWSQTAEVPAAAQPFVPADPVPMDLD